MSIPAERDQEDELGDHVDLPKPRLSLNLEDKEEEDDDEDSFHMPRPRLSLPLHDSDHSERSIELGRRAISEQPSRTLSRGSLGNLIMSDHFGDTTQLTFDAIAETPADDSTLRRQVDNSEANVEDSTGQVDAGSVTFLSTLI